MESDHNFSSNPDRIHTADVPSCTILQLIVTIHMIVNKMCLGFCDDLSIQLLPTKFKCNCNVIRNCRITLSVGATGGVYKGLGRNEHELMSRASEEFLAKDQQLQ